ncbi:ATP-binding protein [Streptomyces sp. KL2]|uniref:ATP-binding protein n=1 Tax=Streptomyces sp. KL2 TaxID=3050126 RepID=UPI00397AC7E3
MLIHRRTFAGRPEEVCKAREWTRKLLADTSCVDDAALIVTELGANAVTHTTGSAFRVTVTRAAEAVTLSVTDTGATTTHPCITHPGAEATHGRGLEIVATLADDVKVHHTAHGHTVTARLPLPAPLPTAREAQPC